MGSTLRDMKDSSLTQHSVFRNALHSFNAAIWHMNGACDSTGVTEGSARQLYTWSITTAVSQSVFPASLTHSHMIWRNERFIQRDAFMPRCHALDGPSLLNCQQLPLMWEWFLPCQPLRISSSLSVLAKVLESIGSEQVKTYLKTQLIQQQSGFWKKTWKKP